MDNKKFATLYCVGLNEIKSKYRRSKFTFNPKKISLLVRLKILFQ